MNLKDCMLLKARDVMSGDIVRFQASYADYMVDEVETTALGDICHRTFDNTRVSFYHPDELLYIERRSEW